MLRGCARKTLQEKPKESRSSIRENRTFPNQVREAFQDHATAVSHLQIPPHSRKVRLSTHVRRPQAGDQADVARRKTELRKPPHISRAATT